MPSYVAFLRAINLGAKRKFPKADLQRVVEGIASGVAVHLNTGNVLLTSRQRSAEAVARTLETAFAADRGFEVPTMAFTIAEVKDIAAQADEVAAAAPFDVGAHYVSFLKEEPDEAAIAALAARGAEGETVAIRGRAVHLLVATGGNYHQVKSAGWIERDLGVATNRNLTVVRELARRWG